MPSCLFLAALAFFCFKANVFSLYCRTQEADSSLNCNIIICPCGLNFEYQYMYWASSSGFAPERLPLSGGDGQVVSN